MSNTARVTFISPDGSEAYEARTEEGNVVIGPSSLGIWFGEGDENNWPEELQDSPKSRIDGWTAIVTADGTTFEGVVEEITAVDVKVLV